MNLFVSRNQCVSCGSDDLVETGSGTLTDGIVGEKLRSSPWAVNPVDQFKGQPWSFVRCGQCNQAFHRHILSPAGLEKYYGLWQSAQSMQEFEKIRGIPAFDPERSNFEVGHLLRIEKLTRTVRGSGQPVVVDFGCGKGRFVRLARAYGCDAYGVDLGLDETKKSEEMFFGNMAEFAKAKSDTIHAITLFQVLEHLDDPLGALKTLRQHMEPGAILFAETPDASGYDDITDEDSYHMIMPLGHINGFTPQTMNQMVCRAGFRRIHAPYVQVATSGVRVLKRMVKGILQPVLPLTTSEYFIAE